MQRLIKKVVAIAMTLLLIVCMSCSILVSYTDKYYSVFGDLYMTISYYSGSDSGVSELAVALDNEINPDIPSSYVAVFNEMQAGEIEVSKSVYELVELSKHIYELSGGAFDITLSDLSKMWNVDHKSLEEYYPNSFPDLPSYTEISAIESSMGNIDVRKDGDKYYLLKSKDNVKIDLGGIAKGYMSDLVQSKLSNNGVKSAIIDVSGNLHLLGQKRSENGDKEDWKIGVNNCFENNGSYLCGTIVGENTAVITSGTYERCYEKNGVKINHIINPHTKMPVGIEFSDGYSNSVDYVTSVTVIGNSGALCDAVATAVCVMGMQDGAKLVEDLNLSAIIVTADKKYTTVGSIRFMKGNFYIDSLEEI